MKTKILAALAFIGALLAAVFRGNAAKAKAKAAEQRADIAEEGLQNASDAKTIDHTVRTSTSAERDRLRDKWTRD
jgi:hypothetical protein